MCSKDTPITRFLHFQNYRWRVDSSMAVRPVFGMFTIGDCTKSYYPEKVMNPRSFLIDSTRNTLHACVAWRGPQACWMTVQCLISTGKSVMKCKKVLYLMLQQLTAEVCWWNSSCICIADSYWSEFKNSLKIVQFLFAGLDKLSVRTCREHFADGWTGAGEVVTGCSMGAGGRMLWWMSDWEGRVLQQG